MSYERLELTDFVDKWDIAKVKHLEDGIVANAEAIERYHNDSIIEMQSDWNQDDSTKKDYIRNKTHYRVKGLIKIANNDIEVEEFEGNVVLRNTLIGIDDISFYEYYVPENDIQFEIDGVHVAIEACNRDDRGNPIWYLSNGLSISAVSQRQWHLSIVNKDEFPFVVGDVFNITIYALSYNYVPLDERYIPNIFLKRGELFDWDAPEGNIYSIKNRTHYTTFVPDQEIYYWNSEDVDRPGRVWERGDPYYKYIGPLGENNGLPGWWMGDQVFHLAYDGQNIIINKYSPWVDNTLRITKDDDIDPSSIIIRVLIHDQDINQRPFYTFEYSITHTGYLRCTFSTAAKVYSPLDEEYIPNTIARTSQVVTSFNGQNGNILLPLDNFVEYETVAAGAGWDLLKNNIHNDDENIVLSKPIDLDNLNLHIVSSDGKEDFITSGSKGLTVSRKDNGSYSLAFVNGVTENSAVYDFRLKGMIDGSGETIIPYVDMVNPEATLSVYQWNESTTKKVIPEDAIPDTVVRKDEIPTIENIVTSINGKIGDVEVSYSDLGMINEEYIPEIIARKNEVETVATFSKDLENNFQQYASTNDATLNNIATNLHDITDNVQKLNNKQIEDYFIGYEEELLVDQFLQVAVNLGRLQRQIVHPLHLKFVNQLTGESQIIVEDDPYLTMEQYNTCPCTYNNPEGSVITHFATDGIRDMVCASVGNINDIVVYQLVPVSGKKKLDEKFIDDAIARISDIPVIDTTLTIEGAAADAKAVGEAISNLENKVDNKQVEEYFNVYEEELCVSSFIEMAAGAIGDCLNELKRPIHLKFVNTLTGETQIVKESDLIITYEGPPEGPTYEAITYNNTNGLIVQHFTITYPSFALFNYHGQCDDIVVYGLIPIDGKKELNEKYIPNTIARAPGATLDYVTETPTAEQYNALLDILKQAGILI